MYVMYGCVNVMYGWLQFALGPDNKERVNAMYGWLQYALGPDEERVNVWMVAVLEYVPVYALGPDKERVDQIRNV